MNFYGNAYAAEALEEFSALAEGPVQINLDSGALLCLYETEEGSEAAVATRENSRRTEPAALVGFQQRRIIAERNRPRDSSNYLGGAPEVLPWSAFVPTEPEALIPTNSVLAILRAFPVYLLLISLADLVPWARRRFLRKSGRNS